MQKKIVTIGLVQTKAGPDMSKNFAHTCDLVIKAAKKGAKIICLQELYNTPYFPQRQGDDKDKYAEYIPGSSTTMFSWLAEDYGVVLIVPVYEKAKNKTGKWEYHNSAAVIDHRGKLLDTYRKIHIPQDPGFYEKDYFKQSDSGYKIYKTKFGTFAVLICYDQWFPEAARAVRLEGAEIIFYPTALGDIIGYKHPNDFHDGWETVIRGHAVANSLVVASVNRVGVEGRMKFFGQSFVADPWGKVLKRASKDKEEILVQKVDLEYNRFLSDGWGFMRNRRPDTYRSLITNKLVDKSKKLKNIEDYRNEKKALGQ
jgi:agmatine deiminase